MNALPEMERRRSATAKTLARYQRKEFDWQRGITCVHLARKHLKNMGHAPQSLPRIRSALGAKRALKANGWASVEVMLDEILPRIAPAQMKLGDLASIPGTEGLDALFVCAGPFKMFGWVDEQAAMALVDIENLSGLKAAWHV